MPKVNSKRIKIDAAKLSAPKVPGNTCPSIDYVQEVIDQIANRGDDWAVKQSDVIRAGQHAHGIDTGECEGVEPGTRGESQRGGLLGAHDQRSRSTVGYLGAVACRHLAVGHEGRLQLGE